MHDVSFYFFISLYLFWYWCQNVISFFSFYHSRLFWTIEMHYLRKCSCIFQKEMCKKGCYSKKRTCSKGLQDMMELYSVKPFYLVLIHYLGGHEFELEIFSPYALEISYPRRRVTNDHANVRITGGKQLKAF